MFWLILAVFMNLIGHKVVNLYLNCNVSVK